MAKKYEFQPDKPYSTWLSKLQLTRQQKLQVLKWGLYALLLILFRDPAWQTCKEILQKKLKK